jgi:hypothetical protein
MTAGAFHLTNGMAAIHRKFGVIRRPFKALLKGVVALETETKIVCAVRRSLLCSAAER